MVAAAALTAWSGRSRSAQNEVALPGRDQRPVADAPPPPPLPPRVVAVAGWDLPAGDPARAPAPVPEVTDGSVLAVRDGALFRLDARTGRTRWRYAPATPITSAPRVVGAQVVVAGDAVVTAVDLDTGEARWTTPTGLVRPRQPAASADVVVITGAPVTGALGSPSGDAAAIALDLTSGAVVWQRELGPGAPDPAVVTDGLVHIAASGADTGTVVSLEAATGEPRWRVDGLGAITAVTATGAAAGPGDPAVYVVGSDNRVTALTAATGELRWQRRVFTPAAAGIARIAADGETVSVSSDTPRRASASVYALDAGSGLVRWRHTPASGIASGPRIVDGAIVVVDRDHGVIALEPSGARRWRIDVRPADLVPAAVRDRGDARATTLGVGADLVVTLDATGELSAVEGDGRGVRWQRSLVRGGDGAGGAGGAVTAAAPALADNTVITVAAGGLAAVAVTGTEQWRRDARAPVIDVTVGDGRVYATEGSDLVVLDLGSGDELWRRRVVWPPGTPAGRVTVAGGRVLVAGPRGIDAYDAARGGHLWHQRRGGVGGTTVAAAGGTIVVIDDAGVVSLDPASGRPVGDGALAACSSPVTAGDVVVVGTGAGLAAVEPATGRLVWESLTDAPRCTLPDGDDDVVVTSDLVREVSAVDTADGALRWRVRADAEITSSPVLANGRVLVGTATGEVLVLDAASGARIGRIPIQAGASVVAIPRVRDGVVAALTDDGRLHAVDESERAVVALPEGRGASGQIVRS